MVKVIDNAASLPRLHARRPESHKGDFGRALLVGGSCGMAGAIGLAGMSALRGGAGLVKLAVPASCRQTVAAFEPSYMTLSLPADEAGRIAEAALSQVVEACAAATAIGCGPGLGRSAGLTRLVQTLFQQVESPMVFDADALNALAEHPGQLATHGGPRILTPHPGEFSRLTGQPAPVSDDQRQASAVELARRTGTVVVLKGHRTVITDGDTAAVNSTGNPGMATGGTGDVLTGLITALLCQKFSPFEAARLGVYVHGCAGDLAAAAFGQVGMIARDLIAYLPQALESVCD